MSHRKAFRRLLCALFLFLGICPLSYGDPVVTGMTLVSEKRVSRTLFDYTYRATVANQGAKVTNVSGTLSSLNPNTTVLDGVISVGDIEENSSALSADAFTIRHDRRYPFDRANLVWQLKWGTSPPQPETILGGASTSIGPEGGTVVLPGFAVVTLAEDVSRAPLVLKVEKILAPDMSSAFAADPIGAGPGMPEIMRIHSTEVVRSPVAVCMIVPVAFISSVPPGNQVELFAEFVHSSDLSSSIRTFERLGASVDSQTGKTCATVPPYAFKPVASVAAYIIAGSYPSVSQNSLFTASNFSPSPSVAAFPNASIAVSGSLTFHVPPVLLPPLSRPLVVNEHFGPRTHPVTGLPNFHTGVDLDAVTGDAVYSAAIGNITHSGLTNGGYGYLVKMRHAGATQVGSETRYAHLDSQGMPQLGPIPSVRAIATADNSGTSTGAHLHFEYRVAGQAQDPMLFIDQVDEQQFLQSLRVVTNIDGNRIPSSEQQVAARDFLYSATIDLTPLALSAGVHMLSVDVENQAGLGLSVHSAVLYVEPTLRVSLNGSGKGAVTSVPQGIVCAVVAGQQPGPRCAAPYVLSTPVALTAGAVPGSAFTGWGGDCVAGQTTSLFSVTMDGDKSCSATFTLLPRVHLKPFGNWNISDGPFYLELIDSSSVPTTSTEDVTVTLLRQVFSQCRGLLFSSNRVVAIPRNQSYSSDLTGYVAGRDPFCNTLPIRTELTITAATLGASTALDLNSVPVPERTVAITR